MQIRPIFHLRQESIYDRKKGSRKRIPSIFDSIPSSDKTADRHSTDEKCTDGIFLKQPLKIEYKKASAHDAPQTFAMTKLSTQDENPLLLEEGRASAGYSATDCPAEDDSDSDCTEQAGASQHGQKLPANSTGRSKPPVLACAFGVGAALLVTVGGFWWYSAAPAVQLDTVVRRSDRWLS